MVNKIYLFPLAVIILGFVLFGFLEAQESKSILKVEPGEQPSSTLAPENARNLVFTRVKLTALGNKDIEIKNFVVENKSLVSNSAFSEVGVDGIGEGGLFNTNNQYETREGIKIKAGKTEEIVITAHMPSNLNSFHGQKASLSLVRIDTDAKIEGALPITGAVHTLNSTLEIGTMTVERGSRDPGAGKDLLIGEKGIVFSSIRVTAGSQEPLRLTTLRWTQTGTMGSADIENLKTYADYRGGVKEFKHKLGSGGKYTASFENEILLEKGESVELYIKGDIVSGPDRTVDFNLDSKSHIKAVGRLYGYELRGSDDHDASVHTIKTGTINVSVSNIEYYKGETKLGTLTFNVKGEAAEIESLELLFASSEGKVTIWDASGNIVAEPRTPSGGKIILSPAWTAPIGLNKYIVTAPSFNNFQLGNISAKGSATKKPIRITR